MDGPDFFRLFQDCKLVAQFHTKEIISWLRFFRDQTNYQTYLKHYLPILSHVDRQQFLADLDDKAFAEEMKKETQKVKSHDVIPPEDLEHQDPQAKPVPAKPGRPKKVFPTK